MSEKPPETNVIHVDFRKKVTEFTPPSKGLEDFEFVVGDSVCFNGFGSNVFSQDPSEEFKIDNLNKISEVATLISKLNLDKIHVKNYKKYLKFVYIPQVPF